MGLIKTENLPDAPVNVRRSLAQLVTDSPEVVTVKNALDALKVQYDSPGWHGNAVAHFVFPKQRKALVIFRHNGLRRLEELRTRWKAQGWEMGSILGTNIVNHTEGDLKGDLKKFLGVK